LQKNGKKAQYTQIRARYGHYPDMFEATARKLYQIEGSVNMATYKEIQEYVKENFGYTPKPCWIAHSKEIYGLSPKTATNRKDLSKREYPCPEEKQEDIKNAFQHFGMI